MSCRTNFSSTTVKIPIGPPKPWLLLPAFVDVSLLEPRPFWIQGLFQVWGKNMQSLTTIHETKDPSPTFEHGYGPSIQRGWLKKDVLHEIYDPHISMWWFPKIGVPPVIIHFSSLVQYKPSSYWGTPMAMESSMSFTSHIRPCRCGHWGSHGATEQRLPHRVEDEQHLGELGHQTWIDSMLWQNGVLMMCYWCILLEEMECTYRYYSFRYMPIICQQRWEISPALLNATGKGYALEAW